MTLVSNEIFRYEDLEQLYSIMAHLYGPSSHRIVVNNKTISSSHELYESMSPKCEVSNLIIGYLRQHATYYKDGGLLMGMVAIKTIIGFKKLSTRLQSITESNNWFMTWYSVQIKTLSFDLNIGRLNQVMKIIRPILCSKLRLTSHECQHLCVLFARVFTMSHPNRDCHVVQIQNGELIDSVLEDGMLLRLDKYFNTNTLNVKSGGKVLIFSVSIALDSEEMLTDTKGNIEVDSASTLKANILTDRVLNLCSKLAAMVDVVICQKVIHPLAKKLLNDKGVVFVDRVGGSCIPLLEKICGCTQVASLTEKNLLPFAGIISIVDSVSIKEKHFIKLGAPDVKTLVLTANDEVTLGALYSCYDKSLVSLRTISSNQKVVCGGGCTETRLVASLLKHRTHSNVKNVNVYMSSLLNSAQAISGRAALYHTVDLNHFHHWIAGSSTCCCGMICKSSAMEYMTFLELLNPDISTVGSWITTSMEDNPELSTDRKLPDILQSESIYSYNILSAIRLSGMVLRIGSKIVAKTGESS